MISLTAACPLRSNVPRQGGRFSESVLAVGRKGITLFIPDRLTMQRQGSASTRKRSLGDTSGEPS